MKAYRFLLLFCIACCLSACDASPASPIETEPIAVTLKEEEPATQKQPETVLQQCDGYRLIEQGDSRFVLNEQNETVYEVPSGTIVMLGYDGYLYDNTDYQHPEITRLGKKPTQRVVDDTLTLYREESTPDSLYIALNNSNTHAGLSEKLNEAEGIVSFYDSTTDKEVTYRYSLTTGEIIARYEGEYVKLVIDDEISKEYLILATYQGHSLLNLRSGNIVSEYSVSLPVAPVLEDIYTMQHTQYLPVEQGESTADGWHWQYGLMDYEGQIIIPLQAKELYYTSFNDPYLVCTEDGLYGLVNVQQEELLPMEYQMVESYKDYVIASKENMLIVYRKDLSVISDQKYALSAHDYSYYRCCEQYNNFSATEAEGLLFIKTYDAEHYYDDTATDEAYARNLVINQTGILQLPYALQCGAVESENVAVSCFYALDPDKNITIYDGKDFSVIGKATFAGNTYARLSARLIGDTEIEFVFDDYRGSQTVYRYELTK